MPEWRPEFHIDPSVRLSYDRNNGWYERISENIIAAWGRVRTANEPTLGFFDIGTGVSGHFVKINLPIPSRHTADPRALGYSASIGWIEGFPINANQGIIGWVGSHGDAFLHIAKISSDPEPGQRWITERTRLAVDFSIVYPVDPSAAA